MIMDQPKRKRGLFGSMPVDAMPQGQELPPVGMAQPVQEPQMPVQQELQQQPRKNDGLRQAAGYFADFAAGMIGQPGPYAGMQAQQRQQADAMAAEQRKRAEGFADWEQREQWKLENPAPDQLTQYMVSAGIDPDGIEAQALYRQAAQNRADPPHMVIGPDGRPQFFRNEQRPPSAPVGRLTPLTDADGAAPVLGNAAANNSISRQEAEMIRQSLGGNGQQAFQQWMHNNNITIRD